MALNTPAKIPLQQAKQDLYKSHILDVAEAVFAHSGYEGTAVKTVAAEARISLSTLYSHFANKSALYRGVHARRLKVLMGRLKEVGRTEPLQQILAAMEIYIAFHMEHPNYLLMHLREGNAWSEETGLHSPEQRATWRAGIETMAKTFRAGIRSGVFVKEDPRLLARTTNALHQVALSHWVETGMKTPQKTVVRTLQGQFIRSFCRPEHLTRLLKAKGLSRK